MKPYEIYQGRLWVVKESGGGGQIFRQQDNWEVIDNYGTIRRPAWKDVFVCVLW